jgi:hypothetical protein
MASSIDLIRSLNRDATSVGTRMLDHSASLPTISPIPLRTEHFSPGKWYTIKL